VSAAAHGERPPQDPYGLSRTKININGSLAVEDYAVWQAAFNRMTESRGNDLDVSNALLFMSQFYLKSPLSKREKESGRCFDVVYHRCSVCDRAWIETDDGPQGIPVAKVAEREKHARVIRLPEPALPLQKMVAVGGGDPLPAMSYVSTDDPRGTSVARFPVQRNDPHGTRVSTPLTPLVPMQNRDKPNTSLIRQQVLGRDGKSCAVPGCPNKGQLYAHHVQWKSHGGQTRISNEISVCARCHGLIHEGLLRVAGQAPHGLAWSGPQG